jgi:transcriptional regulator with XRE-family HTH domain
MSFLFDIGDRRRKTARFISHIREELLRAFLEEKSDNDISQQKIADKLDIKSRSVINRYFSGEANLTTRTIADLAWALDREPVFALKKRTEKINISSGSKPKTATSVLEAHLVSPHRSKAHAVEFRSAPVGSATGVQVYEDA